MSAARIGRFGGLVASMKRSTRKIGVWNIVHDEIVVCGSLFDGKPGMYNLAHYLFKFLNRYLTIWLGPAFHIPSWVSEEKVIR